VARQSGEPLIFLGAAIIAHTVASWLVDFDLYGHKCPRCSKIEAGSLKLDGRADGTDQIAGHDGHTGRRLERLTQAETTRVGAGFETVNGAVPDTCTSSMTPATCSVAATGFIRADDPIGGGVGAGDHHVVCSIELTDSARTRIGAGIERGSS
jgi:hypothetical protein